MRRTRGERDRPTRREHPWERERRLRFARWETEMRRTPYGRPVPDVVGFADPVEPLPHWSDSSGARRLFALSALPTGAGPTYLASVPAGRRRPAAGSLVRLSHPVKGVLPGADPVRGEMLIEARDGSVPATWQDILEGAPPRGATGAARQLAELWNLSVSVTESLLLPLVGSLPWHGRPAGLDLSFEVESWSLARHRDFLSDVLALAPDWVGAGRRAKNTGFGEVELTSGARVRRASPALGRPFSIQLRPASAPPAGRLSADAPPRSMITYGSMLSSEFEAALSAGTAALMVGQAEARRIPRALEMPDALRAAVWGLHWWTPEPPDGPDWHRWLRNEDPRLRKAFGTIPSAVSEDGRRRAGPNTDRREFRDGLAQAAIARARLRGATEVEEMDLAHAVDALVQAIEVTAAWASRGRGPWARTLDRTEGGRTSRLRRTLESLFQERTEGLTAEETMTALRTRGPPVSAWDLENQLERLRIRGLLFQDRSGRYRVA